MTLAMRQLIYTLFILPLFPFWASAQYTLTVEATPAAVMPDAKTYRFYVNFDDANDQISAVFGDVDFPLEVNVPEGAFNTALNSSWNASGINSSFVAIFPELADDSFATLGLAGPASTSGIEGAADPQLAEDAAQPITPFFNTDGATSLLSNSIIGASWFTINTAQNAYAGDDLTLLVMQVTTTGSISGTLTFQLFNQFDLSSESDTEAIQVSVDFDGSGVFYPEGGAVEGCDDPDACNYNPNATIDDGTCEYESCVGCTDEGACNYNPDATSSDDSCDFDSCVGCTFEIACNYNPEATIEDGSCVFFCPGCLDEEACNFDPSALQEDGSCEYASDLGWCDCSGATELDAIGVCGGDCLEDLDADGVCDDVDDCIGFYDTCGVCNGPGEIYVCGCSGLPEGACDCEGQTILDPCGVCGGDGSTCIGCTYEYACNYDPEATIEDFASCEFGTCPGCTDFNACNYNPTITEDDGSCQYIDECGICGGDGIPAGDCDCDGNQLDALGICGGSCEADADIDNICDNVDPCVGEFDNCGTCNGPGAIYDCGCSDIPAGDCDCDGNQLDALGECGGPCEADVNSNGVCDNAEIAGCTDASACNFNASATDEDNSCTYAEVGDCETCLEGNVVVNDADGDGVCDSDETVGCTDPLACNGGFFTDTDNSQCVYAEEACEFCIAGEVVLFDEDGDGVCNGDETVGCTDPLACNGGFFTDTDNSQCIYADEACEICVAGDVVLFDADGDGVCDSDEVSGCTDVLACNFDGFATDEDDSCLYLDQCGVCGGEGIPAGNCDCNGNQIDALGVCGGDCESDENGNGVCDADENLNAYCGWGTYWNEDSAACVLLIPPFDGEFGDYSSLNPCYFDLDLSGEVGANDLLNLLNTYGQEAGCSWSSE